MSNAYSNYNAACNQKDNQDSPAGGPQMSRIETDVDRIKGLCDRVNTIAHRIHQHARAMGYYQPTPEIKASACAPVVLTMLDVITDLDRAVDAATGALNLFE